MGSKIKDPRPLQQTKVDDLQVEVYPTRRDLGTAAGRAAADRIRSILAGQERCRIIFAAAPSQNEFLEELASAPGIEWNRVTAFHMDEYAGLSSQAPQSFVYWLKQHIFDLVRPGEVHFLNGMASDLEAEAVRYSALLQQAPIDIVCAGIGENGHLAFNDPPYALFDDPQTVKVIELALRSREQQVHDGCFDRLEDVPTHALTVTVPALMSARRIFCMVPGPTKAEAMLATLTGPLTEDCPASILRRHPAATLYGDSASASLLGW